MATPKNIKPVSHSKRKLVKGSATALPAILTLHSGAVFALSSTNQCIESDRNGAGHAPSAVTTQDPWARVPFESVTLQEAKIKNNAVVATGNSTFYVIWTSEKEWKNLDPLPRSNDYHTFIAETRFGVDVMRFKGFGQKRLFKVVGKGTILVLAQFNTDGIIVGYGASTEGNPITGSCWTSINPSGFV